MTVTSTALVVLSLGLLFGWLLSKTQREHFEPVVHALPNLVPTQIWDRSVPAANVSRLIGAMRLPVVLLDSPAQDWAANALWSEDFLAANVGSVSALRHTFGSEWMYEFDSKPLGGDDLPLGDELRVKKQEVLARILLKHLQVRSSTTSRIPEEARPFFSALIPLDPVHKSPFKHIENHTRPRQFMSPVDDSLVCVYRTHCLHACSGGSCFPTTHTRTHTRTKGTIMKLLGVWCVWRVWCVVCVVRWCMYYGLPPLPLSSFSSLN
jgi:hypothetical protein